MNAKTRLGVALLVLATAAKADTVATFVSGGGRVIIAATPNYFVSSFGVHALAVAGPLATGRINYDEHADLVDNHVTAPVVSMAGTIGAGGRAALVGNCGAK